MRRRRPTTRITDPLVAQLFAAVQSTRPVRRPPTDPPIRVMLVEQHRLTLLGLRGLFDTARNCEVVAEATDVESAVERARIHQPEVVIMDADLPENGGSRATQQISEQNPRCRVVALASAVDAQNVIGAIHAGVSGYLLKRTEPDALVDAVEVVAAGGAYVEEPFVTAVLEWFQAGQPAFEPLERLSTQERRTLSLIAEGKTNRDIATALGLSEYTVKTYVSAVLKKLNLRSRAEAAAFFSRRESPSP